MIFFAPRDINDFILYKLTTRFEECSEEQMESLRFSAEGLLSQYGNYPYCAKTLVCFDESGPFFLYEVLIFKDNLSMFVYIDFVGKDLFTNVKTI